MLKESFKDVKGYPDKLSQFYRNLMATAATKGIIVIRTTAEKSKNGSQLRARRVLRPPSAPGRCEREHLHEAHAEGGGPQGAGAPATSACSWSRRRW